MERTVIAENYISLRFKQVGDINFILLLRGCSAPLTIID